MNTSESVSGYAYWISPDRSAKVVYSLVTMQEIDTLVNDGYRRIPHGGVETGGILFGTRQAQLAQIEAFRPIECQHAYGPSFVLSESDLVALREQLTEAASDPALEGLRPIGWFLGHTRSPLQVQQRELAWFNEFFPEPGSLTLLVKPERFQPTQFGFLLRRSDGYLEQDATQSAVILPLSGSGSNAAERAAPSIPAPKAEYDAPKTPVPVAPPVVAPAAGGTTRVRNTRQMDETQAAPPPVSPFASALEKTRVSAMQSSAEPREAEAPRPMPKIELPDRRVYAVERSRSIAGLSLRSAGVLLLAAILGCLAGYWAYLQLPSPAIPVSVRERNGQLTVEWPAAQTENVEYAAIQVDNGSWMPLTPEQKTAGRAMVTAPPGDVKIDIMAKHWLRDSRGIVRYIRTGRAVR